MLEANAELIFRRLRPTDLVLDIGGWARPFNRANYVMDQEPYETRGYYGLPPQGGEREHFRGDTWIRRDICGREPFPFADKELDFVICSHTLEDIRDPLWVCSEMVRVAKAGYIEVPSRLAETCRGIEPGQAGWSHHRWLIDIADGEVRFLMKYHKIHSHWRLSFPERFFRRLPEERQVQWLFWEGSFAWTETVLHGVDTIEAELERYVCENRPYPGWLVRADRSFRTALSLPRRAVAKVRRTVSGR